MGTDNKDGNDGKMPWRRPPLKQRLKAIVDDYFVELSGIPKSSWPSDKQIGWDILSDMQKHIHDMNAVADKGDIRDVMVRAIPPSLVTEIVLRVHRFVMVDFIGGDKNMTSSVLAMYMEDGPFAGTYTISEIVIRDAIRQFSNDISRLGLWSVMDMLKSRSPMVEPCRDARYVAMNNGIWDDTEKKFLSFTPDLVFTSKSTINYDPSTVQSGFPLCNYRKFDDPVFKFWDEFREVFVWDLLPFSFLYDLFKQWFKKKYPFEKVLSYRRFICNLRISADMTGGWDAGVCTSMKPGRKMDEPEHLIIE